MFYRDAGVAELADAQDLKSCGGDIVPVRSRSPAVRDFSLDYFADKCIILVIDYVCVAQLDRALGYGPRCRGFESAHARYIAVSYTHLDVYKRQDNDGT